ncbi:GVQW3 [Cordylochernes scorpioides]|uniref:GVQW3 n=1 Tax=Cordylochernes scorpioides TaxID=51811 RepID=A0ABY6JWN5_9ARAC|nr:GVQW3 [Cordylochernes scorpioides]
MKSLRCLHTSLSQQSRCRVSWVCKAVVLGPCQFSVVVVMSNEEPQMSPYISITAAAMFSILETLDLLKLAFGNENVNKPTTFRWFSRFKNGMVSVKDEKRVGRPILHRNPEKMSQISNFIKENP